MASIMNTKCEHLSTVVWVHIKMKILASVVDLTEQMCSFVTRCWYVRSPGYSQWVARIRYRQCISQAKDISTTFLIFVASQGGIPWCLWGITASPEALEIRVLDRICCCSISESCLSTSHGEAVSENQSSHYTCFSCWPVFKNTELIP